MNWLLISASALAFLTAAVHIFVGGNDVAKPLIDSALVDDAKYALYACWHFISAFFVISALIFLAEGLGSLDSRLLIMTVSILWLVFGFVFLFLSLKVNTSRGLLRLPQWVLLFPVGILGFVSILRPYA